MYHDLFKRPDPIRASSYARDTEKESLPIPSLDPVQIRQAETDGKLKQLCEKYSVRLTERGIIPEKIIEAQERAYRELPSEKYADEFAARQLRNL